MHGARRTAAQRCAGSYRRRGTFEFWRLIKLRRGMELNIKYMVPSSTKNMNAIYIYIDVYICVCVSTCVHLQMHSFVYALSAYFV